MSLKNRMFLALLLVFAVACSKDDDVINKILVDINVNMPKQIETKNPVLESAIFTFENVNTGAQIVREETYIPQTLFNVETGLYHLKVQGKVRYTAKSSDGKIIEKTTDVRAIQQNIEGLEGNFNLDLDFSMYTASTGFLISEVFYSGTNTPEGKAYLGGDQYIEIYNNSREIMYADGLCIAETSEIAQTTQSLNELTPDFRSDGVVVSAVYRIPGSGKDYPLKPGEHIVLCDVAINHKDNNVNSFDLSKADFEWFDGSEVGDVDVPEVKNLTKLLTNTSYAWHPNPRGRNSFILFRLDKDISPEDFINQYAFSFSHKLIIPGYGSFEYSEDTWKIPNSKIIDAVQCSVPSEFQWNIFSADLDISYAHCGDGASYNRHSIKRKVIGLDGEQKLLQDTNDSAFDFLSKTEPSPGIIEDFQ